LRIANSGNVGIGTTNPDELLTIFGVNPKIKIRNSLNTSNKSISINLENGSNSEWIICNSNNQLTFDFNNNISSSNKFIIDGPSGNIGIGTSYHIPTQEDRNDYKLNIAGNVKVRGDIIPSNNSIYNLGSSSNRWKDLYLSGNSIYLEDLELSRDSNSNLNIKDNIGNYRNINLDSIQLNNNNNQLKIGIDANGNITYTTANNTYYPVTTTNIENTVIMNGVNNIIIDTSNYAIETSNKLATSIKTNDENHSNYVLYVNQDITDRITDLTTDMITENMNANNKFIVNDKYNNNLVVNGNLTINSNLIVLGASTTLETTVYTTERLELVNSDNTQALFIHQKNISGDIIVASNINRNVFNVTNNGDVNIVGIYKKNNRDVFNDTSNYEMSTSNILLSNARTNYVYASNYTLSTNNIQNNKINLLDYKFQVLIWKESLHNSNFVTSSSNIV